MVFKLPINAHETTNTTGTGDLTLAGAVSGARTFSAEMSNGDITEWCLAPNGSTDREFHRGAWNTGGILTRSTGTLIESTTGGLINLGAGPHDVFVERGATRLLQFTNSVTGRGFLVEGLTASKSLASGAFVAVDSWNTPTWVTDNCFVASTGIFTPPITGLYSVVFSGMIFSIDDGKRGITRLQRSTGGGLVYTDHAEFWRVYGAASGSDNNFIGGGGGTLIKVTSASHKYRIVAFHDSDDAPTKFLTLDAVNTRLSIRYIGPS